mgnify:CR=1 FL=1
MRNTVDGNRGSSIAAEWVSRDGKHGFGDRKVDRPDADENLAGLVDDLGDGVEAGGEERLAEWVSNALPEPGSTTGAPPLTPLRELVTIDRTITAKRRCR